MGTSYGISEQSYGCDNAVLGGTRQVNIFSGYVCTYVSYLMFKELEKKIGDSNEV